MSQFVDGFDVRSLTQSAFDFAKKNGLHLSVSRCRRIVLKEIRIIGREDERRFGLRFETSDDYRTTSYSDPTGEQAVRNVIRSLMVNA